MGYCQVSNLHVKFVGASFAISWDETNVVALRVSLVFYQKLSNLKSIGKEQKVSRSRLLLLSNLKLQLLVVQLINLGDRDAHPTQDVIK